MTTLHLSRKKIKKRGLKKYVKVVSIKNKRSSNEFFFNEMY